MGRMKMLIAAFIMMAIIGSMAVIGGSMLAKDNSGSLNKTNQQFNQLEEDLK
jgi:hypothetical protein